MQELFEDISEKTRQDCAAVFSIATHANSILEAIKILEAYRDTLTSREQDYMDFAFHGWMEAHGIYGESNSNQW